ncbi:hypothetical protein PHMEG_0009690 [Phytophthora megakarya]|uniref:Uncharacterized protein n=1 Tax=Phytophthora megakarya TaxID=4795 RepID=A0A225WFK2_9STRA|nr:hypothetical protein PHMEG_0009690 [Phytophthora megakarya]
MQDYKEDPIAIFERRVFGKKVANRVTRVGLNINLFTGVIRPDVYIDESFCNVHHGKTWLTSDKVRYATSGKGTRFVAEAKEVRNSSLKRKH